MCKCFLCRPQPPRITSPVWRPIHSGTHWSSEKLTDMESATELIRDTAGDESWCLTDGDSWNVLICSQLKGYSVRGYCHKWAASEATCERMLFRVWWHFPHDYHSSVTWVTIKLSADYSELLGLSHKGIFVILTRNHPLGWQITSIIKNDIHNFTAREESLLKLSVKQKGF